jgi:NAD(P)-dependent dehydrogenase (short-subunit alcohol dehydrogenase family)
VGCVGRADGSPPVSRELDGTRAFITGGGTGIGLFAAVVLAVQGAFATVAGGTGEQAEFVVCDGTDESSVTQAVAVAGGSVGRLDFGVNSDTRWRHGKGSIVNISSGAGLVRQISLTNVAALE